jgi:UTP-glucose-1-phosphate uridylyltransferase
MLRKSCYDIDKIKLLWRYKMKKTVLVVLAAGIGSRYGGLKQMDPVGRYDEAIIEYSVFDAIEAGFEEVIFIINHKIENDFKEIIGKRVELFIRVQYAFQELDDVPCEIVIPKDRVKPFGTAHAVYAARHLIQGPFAIINADDYYGKEAFAQLYTFLKDEKKSERAYAMVGYMLKNTVTENGYVSRGICSLDEDENLKNVVERVHIEKRPQDIAYLEEQQWTTLPEETIVSMNMWGLKPSFLEEVEATIVDFLSAALEANPLKSEFYLPYVVDQMVQKEKAQVKVLKTSEKWYGVTYQEDKKTVVEAINTMIDEGKYPEKLWRIK